MKHFQKPEPEVHWLISVQPGPRMVSRDWVEEHRVEVEIGEMGWEWSVFRDGRYTGYFGAERTKEEALATATHCLEKARAEARR